MNYNSFREIKHSLDRKFSILAFREKKDKNGLKSQQKYYPITAAYSDKKNNFLEIKNPFYKFQNFSEDFLEKSKSYYKKLKINIFQEVYLY